MKKLIFAIVAAAISVGAAMPASAWGYDRCNAASVLAAITVGNNTIAKECHRWIVGEGLISKGQGAGERWDMQFPKIHFVAAEAADVKVAGNTHYTYTVEYHNSIRTKRIAVADISDYLKKIHHTKKDVTDYTRGGNRSGEIHYKFIKDEKGT